MAVRHKCFISYHFSDKEALDLFYTDFEGDFIHRSKPIAEDIINSDNQEASIGKIRELYLQDSTVTIILVGRDTWSRKFVDWEVQASLHIPKNGSPNGLLAIQLWESHKTLPKRVELNVNSGYAKYYKYPSSTAVLAKMVDEAWHTRTDLADKIVNPVERLQQDLPGSSGNN